MSKIQFADFFQYNSLTAGQWVNDDNQLARRIAGLGVSILEGDCAIYWGPEKNRIIIEAPAVYWVWEGKYCEYGATPGRKWNNAYVQIVGDVARDFVDAGLFPCSDRPFISLPPDSIIFEHFHAMYDLYCQDPVNNTDKCLWYIMGIGLEVKRLFNGNDLSGKFCKEIIRLKKEIFENPNKEYDFNAIARKFRISRKYFNKKFSEINNLPPHNTIIHAKLRLGMKLLLENYSVKEAAEASGFSSASYFSKLFKKYYNIPPRDVMQKNI